jgi:hypothetical protein
MENLNFKFIDSTCCLEINALKILIKGGKCFFPQLKVHKNEEKISIISKIITKKKKQ